MATFGQRFKQLRIERGLTQEQIADHFHTDKSSISKYEHDKNMPNNIEEFADYLGVSVDYLLGRTDDKNNREIEYKTKESFVIELLHTMVKQGLIDDVNNISESMKKLIIDAILIEYKKYLESKG